MHMATAICTNPLGGVLSSLIGSRKSFILLLTIGIIGYITMAFSQNIVGLFVGRFMTIVCASTVAPKIGVQISETVHSSMRGSFSVFHSVFNNVGMLIVLRFGYCVRDWRELALVSMIPGCLHLLVVFFLHDTPYWLVEYDAKEEAIKSLQFYRGPNFDINEELSEIIQQKEAKDLLTNTGCIKSCFSALGRIFSPAFG
jgi:SP family facilitated glucose transporter-like MFS transporter 8